MHTRLQLPFKLDGYSQVYIRTEVLKVITTCYCDPLYLVYLLCQEWQTVRNRSWGFSRERQQLQGVVLTSFDEGGGVTMILFRSASFSAAS